MHARMTFTLDTHLIEQLKAIIPAQQRSQFAEKTLAKALQHLQMEADYRAMANDVTAQADAEYFQDMCGEVGNEPW